jgi:hypothetical protein
MLPREKYRAGVLVTVFEASNVTRKEIYAGTTAYLLDQLVKDFKKRPPKAASHWKEDDEVAYHCVEYALPPGDAQSFLEGYSRSAALMGWKVVRD